MEPIYYEIAILLNKRMYEEEFISYEKYLKVEKALLKEITV